MLDLPIDVLAPGPLTEPGVLREGREVVLAGRPGTPGQGWRRDSAGRKDPWGPHHGRLPPPAGAGSPPGSLPGGLPLLDGGAGKPAASGYLYRAGLRIRPPSDPDFRSGGHLAGPPPPGVGPCIGSSSATLRESREAGTTPPMKPLCWHWRWRCWRKRPGVWRSGRCPPGGRASRDQGDGGAGEGDVTAFVPAQVVRDGAPWEALELRFGPEVRSSPWRSPCPGGPFSLRGAAWTRVGPGRLGLGGGGLQGPGAPPGTARIRMVFHGGRRLPAHPVHAGGGRDQGGGGGVHGLSSSPTGRGATTVSHSPERRWSRGWRWWGPSLTGAYVRGASSPSDDSGDMPASATSPPYAGMQGGMAGPLSSATGGLGQGATGHRSPNWAPTSDASATEEVA